jgi:hypothetical protein
LYGVRLKIAQNHELTTHYPCAFPGKIGSKGAWILRGLFAILSVSIPFSAPVALGYTCAHENLSPLKRAPGRATHNSRSTARLPHPVANTARYSAARSTVAAGHALIRLESTMKTKNRFSKPFRINVFSATLFLSASLSSAAAFAQEPPPIRAERLQAGERIVLDGTLSAPAWQRAPVFSRFVELSPNRGAPAKYETRVQVLYDDHALYVGVTALDPQPAQMREVPVRHDFVNRTQDFIVLYIDAVGKKKAAQFFRLNSSGATADGLHTADNDNEDFSPDFDFDGASVRNDAGYTAVFRVPYSSLRFAGSNGGDWRIMVGRRTPREQFTLDLSVPLAKEAASFIDNLQKLEGFTPPAIQSFLQLRPTLTARQTRNEQAGVVQRERELKPSLDIKWRPRAELVIDAALNPDFSQVELDVPQLARNTRFALFLNEKRPLFLESSDLLNSPTDALYTRTINDPRWATRASWRGTWGDASLSGTAITAQDRGGGLTLLPGAFGTGAALQPESQTLMSRARVDAHNYAYGALLTHRSYEGGAGSNTVAGADANWAITEAWRWRGQLLASHTTALPDANGTLAKAAAQDGLRLYTGVNRRTAYNNSAITVDVSDAQFRNDAGFVTQVGVRKIEAEHQLTWEGLGRLNSLNVYLKGDHTQDRASGQTVARSIHPGMYLTAARNTEITAELRAWSALRSSANAPLVRERYLHLFATNSPAQWLPFVETEWDIGKLADIDTNRVRNGFKGRLYARVRPIKPLELEPSITRLALRGADAGGNALTETAAQLLAIWHLAPKQSLRLIAQSTRFNRAADAQAGLVTDSGRRSTQSLTYAWRQSAGSVFYAGATRADAGTQPTRARDNEVFVKWQADVGEWLGW